MPEKINARDVLRKIADYTGGSAAAVLNNMLDVVPQELAILAEASGQSLEHALPLGNGYSVVVTVGVEPTPPGPRAN